MASTPPSIADEIERYLQTGQTDMMADAWPGDLMERGERSHDDLRGALVLEVRRLTDRRTHHPLTDVDTAALTRSKIERMVRGLFPRAEHDLVLAAREKFVVFLSSVNIEQILRSHNWDKSAWDIANLFLMSVGAELLGEDAPRIVGMSEELVCFVAADYFAETSPFADFVVHEVAHIFHNCKRRTIGLRETRSREWLLDIEYRERETFAYACEAYSKMIERGDTVADHRALAAEYAREPRISDEHVDPAKVVAIVEAAAAARNGWKVILARCAPVRRSRAAVEARVGTP